MTTTYSTLVLVRADGSTMEVANEYEAIKEALDHRPFDYVVANERFGCYIDDEGMFLNLPLNVPVSLQCGRPIYGPAVCCNGNPDDEGDTLPMDDTVRQFLKWSCVMWNGVVRAAEEINQDPYAYANGDTVPPPTITFLDNEEEIASALGRRETVIFTDKL